MINETGNVGAFAVTTGYASFFQALRSEPIVNRILRSENGSFEDCILALANDRKRLLKRIEELESIAPKKIQAPDGTVMIWRCPDELVPLPNTAIRHAAPDSSQLKP